MAEQLMDLETAKQRQTELQQEADAILKEYRIIERLEALGDVQFVGSYRYGLMVLRDIDIEVHHSDYSPSQIYDYCKDLFMATRRISFIDRTALPKRDDRPVGVRVGCEIDKPNSRWKLDIWVFPEGPEMATQHQSLSEIFDADWFERTTQQQRDAMLLLKHQLHEEGTYNKPVASYQVYQAVLKGVDNLEDFKTWLARTYKLEI
jgi:hypothetical protein